MIFMDMYRGPLLVELTDRSGSPLYERGFAEVKYEVRDKHNHLVGQGRANVLSGGRVSIPIPQRPGAYAITYEIMHRLNRIREELTCSITLV